MKKTSYTVKVIRTYLIQFLFLVSLGTGVLLLKTRPDINYFAVFFPFLCLVPLGCWCYAFYFLIAEGTDKIRNLEIIFLAVVEALEAIAYFVIMVFFI